MIKWVACVIVILILVLAITSTLKGLIGARPSQEPTVSEAQALVTSVLADDVRTLTYLATLSDMLNRSWLEQALPYSLLSTGLVIGTGLLLLAIALLWRLFDG